MQNPTSMKSGSELKKPPMNIDINRILALVLFLVILIFIFFLYRKELILNNLDLQTIYGVTKRGKIVDTIVIQRENEPPCKIVSVLNNGVKDIQNDCNVKKQPSNINIILIGVIFISLTIIYLILNFSKII